MIEQTITPDHKTATDCPVLSITPTQVHTYSYAIGESRRKNQQTADSRSAGRRGPLTARTSFVLDAIASWGWSVSPSWSSVSPYSKNYVSQNYSEQRKESAEQ